MLNLLSYDSQGGYLTRPWTAPRTKTAASFDIFCFLYGGAENCELHSDVNLVELGLGSGWCSSEIGFKRDATDTIVYW